EVAVGDRLDLLELLDSLGALRLCAGELVAELLRRGEEVVAPLHGSLRESRIGEMGHVADAAPLLLGVDLVVEVLGHPLEFGNHGLDLRDLATFLVDLEALQPDQTFSRLHDGSLLRAPCRTAGTFPASAIP